MLRGGISDPRNKAIMKLLNLIAIGERAGSGVPDIYSVWADKGWKDPEIKEQFNPDRTILTLVFTKKQAEKTSGKASSQSITLKHQDDALKDALEKLLDEIEENPRITQQELSKNLALSRATIQRMIKMLIAAGIIDRKGGKRFGYWEVINNHTE